MESEESSKTRWGIHNRLHGATEAVKEERKRSRMEAAWKVKKA